ncbi:hypothetical protein [Methanolobus psychrotolerans]|uniref:hypothetical protein n=1 Tax=Methanolobus psychrotolerans TaxID=1874706 RepID=UPI00101AE9A2|nr:hypothetical protein [Methanolobus psychrotolerans]
MATFLGIIGVISSFIVFYIGLHVLNLDQDVLQSFIFLKLAVAGHLTIFLARTRGPFWSILVHKTKWDSFLVNHRYETAGDSCCGLWFLHITN